MKNTYWTKIIFTSFSNVADDISISMRIIMIWWYLSSNTFKKEEIEFRQSNDGIFNKNNNIQNNDKCKSWTGLFLSHRLHVFGRISFIRKFRSNEPCKTCVYHMTVLGIHINVASLMNLHHFSYNFWSPCTLKFIRMILICAVLVSTVASLPFTDEDLVVNEISQNSINEEKNIDLSILGPAAFGSPTNESGKKD